MPKSKTDKAIDQAWAKYHACMQGSPEEAKARKEYEALVEARQARQRPVPQSGDDTKRG